MTPFLSQIGAQLPRVSPGTWRVVGFGAAALVAVLLIASQFTTSGRKPVIPPIVTNAAMPQPASSGDEGDIGQTGAHHTGTAPGGGHTGNDNSDTGNAGGDSGDIGQGGTH